ncbi:hypothetical protein [Sedimentibacter sp.]|uniref:hypothetical protein n=1 Tax=Sedimentibacter sp. TaxID=1960295 RepID=UPI0028B1EA7B|nr:hypothetical protein [Sedimentibacter sp.]
MFNKIFIIVASIIVVSITIFSVVNSYTAEDDIEGEYVFVDLSYVSPISSTFWTKESRENIRYVIDKDYFSIGDDKWLNTSYTKEKIDSVFVQDNYGSELLTKEYTRIFFSKNSNGYRYIIVDENKKEIGYHIFRIGEETYICETFEDYKKNGFVKVEKIKKD